MKQSTPYLLATALCLLLTDRELPMRANTGLNYPASLLTCEIGHQVGYFQDTMGTYAVRRVDIDITA